MTAPEDTTEPREPAADRESAGRLERKILGETPGLTADEVAAQVGIELVQARRLWRALGFPDVGESAAFTESDVAALRDVSAAVGGGLVDAETVVRMTRGIGVQMSRLADWEVGLLTVPVEAAEGSRTDRAMKIVDELGGPFEDLLIYAWRRHLAAAVGRVVVLGSSEDDLQLSQATAGFADLVRFSELSNALSDHAIGDLVEVFEGRAHDVVAEYGGRMIKTLGDSVLFLTENPEQAVDIALAIIGVIGHDQRLPDVRLGLATGPVVLRMGDVYGPAVNLASRLTNVARRNRVIIDEHTAELLGPAFEVRRLPARPVRGFGEVEPLTVRRTRDRHGF